MRVAEPYYIPKQATEGNAGLPRHPDPAPARRSRLTRLLPSFNLMANAFFLKMPFPLRLRAILIAVIGGLAPKRRLALMREMGQRRRFTVPREQIDWYPTIDPTTCLRCRICYEFCPKDVFTVARGSGEVQVTSPYNCVVLCSGCQPRCPWGAISFPNKSAFRHYVYYV